MNLNERIGGYAREYVTVTNLLKVRSSELTYMSHISLTPISLLESPVTHFCEYLLYFLRTSLTLNLINTVRNLLLHIIIVSQCFYDHNFIVHIYLIYTFNFTNSLLAQLMLCYPGNRFGYDF